MSFCAICGAHHDPNIPCADRAGEILQDIGIKRTPKKHRKEFKKLEKAADRYMIKFFLIGLAFLTLFILLGVLVQRSKLWLLAGMILIILIIIFPKHKFKKRLRG